MRVTSPSSIGHRHGGPQPASPTGEQKVDNVCRFVLLLHRDVLTGHLSLLPSHEHWCLGRPSWRWTFYGFSNECHHSEDAGHEGEGLQRMKQWEEKNSFQQQRDRDVANLLPAVASESPVGGFGVRPLFIAGS